MSETAEVLVLAPRFPLPLTSGTQIREYHILRALANRFDITLISLVQDGEGEERISELSEVATTIHTVPHKRSKKETLLRFMFSRQSYRVCKLTTPAFKRRVRDVVAQSSFDLVWANFLNTVPALPNDANCPVILDEHTSDVRDWESFLDGGILEQTIAWLNIRRIRRLRRIVKDQIDGIVSVSGADADEARKWAGEPVWPIPNGVDIDEFSPSVSAANVSKRVVFVGSLDVRMNEEAVVWFIENAWPEIYDTHPDATFAIVGQNSTERVQQSADTPGVELVGKVPSVVPQYDQAAVAIAPFQFGGGTKLKVLEALAMERPLVTTSVGKTGISLTDGKQALVRERDSSFAEAVIDLLDSPEKRMALGDRARSFVKQEFAWEALAETGISQVVSDILIEPPKN